MNPNSLTEEQIKAMIYDQLVLSNQCQANIKILEEELGRRKSTTTTEGGDNKSGVHGDIVPASESKRKSNK